MELRGKRALVMGLGVHGGGLGVARFLVGQGADVTITDLRSPDQLRPSLAALEHLPVRLVLGEHRDDDFRSAELVVRNPAVPGTSRYLQIARDAGAAIEMEMTLFFRLCPGPILGVTGTKGKTTTTLLLGAMVQAQHPDAVIAGNMRISALEQLPRITPATPVVLELSSFVLEGLGEAGLSPPFALVTNLSPDHLDRYGTMAAYATAKREIFRSQGGRGVVALNLADTATAPWAADAPGEVVWFSPHPPAGDDGRAIAFCDPAGVWWRPAGGAARLVCPADDVRLPGAHNLANVAGATALAAAFGVADAAIRRAIGGFGGVEHRLELVRELGGVRYVNDTAATAPEAAIAALRSFGAPVVLIAGGADKRLPLDDLAREIVGRAKAVVLLQGTATERLRAALAEQAGGADRRPAVLGPYDDFGAAVRAARAQAAAGDIVLLSPGCASFGMFRNEFHRGEEFRRIVGEL